MSRNVEITLGLDEPGSLADSESWSPKNRSLASRDILDFRGVKRTAINRCGSGFLSSSVSN